MQDRLIKGKESLDGQQLPVHFSYGSVFLMEVFFLSYVNEAMYLL